MLSLQSRRATRGVIPLLGATAGRAFRFESTKVAPIKSASNSSPSRDLPSSRDRLTDADTQELLDQLFMSNKKSWNTFSNRKQPQQGNAKLDAKLRELQEQPVNFNYYLRNLKDLTSSKQLPYKFGSNQHVTNDPKMTKLLQRILWEYDAPVRYAFGYGSKVFSQGDNVDISNSQLDMIFAVSFPDHWHSINLHQHPDQYSGLKYLGSNAVARIGNWGAGVYYNPFVRMNFERSTKTKSDFELKYGVTSIDNMIDDLTNWSTMYLAGRMHKPVAIARDVPQISLLEQFNLVSALKLSLLLLNKSEIKESELYETVASISYLGDPRTKVGGENPHKVQNIVTNQFALFRELYEPLIKGYLADTLQLQTTEDASDHIFKVNMDTHVRAGMVAELPRKFREKLLSKYVAEYQNEFAKDLISQNTLNKLPSVTKDSLAKPHKKLTFAQLQELSTDNSTLLTQIPIEDWEYIPADSDFKNAAFLQKIAQDKQFVDNLHSCIKQTVAQPAMLQSMKGVLTAGVAKSWKYAWEKRRKYKAATKA